MRKARLLTGLVAATTVLALSAPAAWADARAVDDSCPPGMPSSGFTDVPSSNSHGAAIDCVVHWEIAQGTGAGRYSPGGAVTRAQMATFISRLITESGGSLPGNLSDAFDDDNGNTHERAINALAAAKIVTGKSARRYDPSGVVTRDQMATFLVRAYDYRTSKQLAVAEDAFDDDNSNIHESNINKAAAAGFAAGISARQYAPSRAVARDQMASFLARVLDKLVEEDGAKVPPAPPMYLAGTGVSSTDCRGPQDLSINGQKYSKAVRCAPGGNFNGPMASAEYDLGREYKRLTVRVGQPDDSSDSDQIVRIRILGDGKELYTRDLALGESEDVVLDMSGVLRLRFEMTNATASGANFVQGALGDPAVQAF